MRESSRLKEQDFINEPVTLVAHPVGGGQNLRLIQVTVSHQLKRWLHCRRAPMLRQHLTRLQAQAQRPTSADSEQGPSPSESL
ncbi:hypothetical protein CY34DRAFT_807742, partial [Suillus luteus UH-Slu-Lm8-n1]